MMSYAAFLYAWHSLMVGQSLRDWLRSSQDISSTPVSNSCIGWKRTHRSNSAQHTLASIDVKDGFGQHACAARHPSPHSHCEVSALLTYHPCICLQLGVLASTCSALRMLCSQLSRDVLRLAPLHMLCSMQC